MGTVEAHTGPSPPSLGRDREARTVYWEDATLASSDQDE